METQAWSNMFNHYNAHEETIEKDEEMIDSEVANLKHMQSAINMRLTQLQTAKAMESGHKLHHTRRATKGSRD
jgi:hypothetical protein